MEATIVERKTAVPTVSEIARRAGVPNHKVVYLLRRRAIRPIGFAGAVQVFDDLDAERVVAELKRIAEFRSSTAFVEGAAPTSLQAVC